jgi:chromosomal replication initiation ATPase DnaA
MTGIVSTHAIASIATAPRKPEAAFPALAGRLPDAPGRILVQIVLRLTAEHYGTTADELISGSRTQPLARRRQVAMYVAHKMTGRGLPFIGHHMGGRCHTTILHGERAVKAPLDVGDAGTIAAVGVIKERLRVLRTGRA